MGQTELRAASEGGVTYHGALNQTRHATGSRGLEDALDEVQVGHTALGCHDGTAPSRAVFDDAGRRFIVGAAAADDGDMAGAVPGQVDGHAPAEALEAQGVLAGVGKAGGVALQVERDRGRLLVDWVSRLSVPVVQSQVQAGRGSAALATARRYLPRLRREGQREGYLSARNPRP